MKRKLKTKYLISSFFKYTVMIIAVLIVIVPLIPIILGSFKNGFEFQSSGVFELPRDFTLQNYVTAFTDGNMLLGFFNTVLILVISLIVSILTGAMVAYVLHRFRFKGHSKVKALFLIAALLPSITNNIATFQIVSRLGIFNTRFVGILLFSGTDIISVYIMLQFLDNISTSLDESAMMDGASYFTIFFKIILPLLMPAAITVGIIKGVAIYNDFITPYLFMPSSELAMISTALFNFKGPFAAQWEVISAGIVITALPILIVFLISQKWIYNGLVLGSVKE
ncbi:carbohydrate ABC transporter permease [Acholeplasma hippikon]|uniref:Inner membrane ABC transporter permease protein ycjP n=1 Tax=Acholeplasma hippikon TaxID=264636 RepID=A0A449BLI8_9MOLU|nr:carbohydrate ABC transporter permease [Acholeplasma hippikon]VEU83304.1 Inner membrane ABC transporter permease protein ycjP [Acholeplasma hippikon]